jgi:hypothetical protein
LNGLEEVIEVVGDTVHVANGGTGNVRELIQMLIQVVEVKTNVLDGELKSVFALGEVFNE